MLNADTLNIHVYESSPTKLTKEEMRSHLINIFQHKSKNKMSERSPIIDKYKEITTFKNSLIAERIYEEQKVVSSRKLNNNFKNIIIEEPPSIFAP